jgi:hypothetical protein
VTSAKRPGFRLVGTWDDDGTLLFSQGQKNFVSKDSCHQCSKKKPMMYRYALAKKGEKLNFSEEIYCSMDCFSRHYDTLSRGIAKDKPG